MAQSKDIRIIWKTNCKWRDTDYYVKQDDVRPLGSCKDKSIKEGDAVKVKYGTRWYNAEVVEIRGIERDEVVQVVDEVRSDDHYQQFLALQGKRERDWKVVRELARKKKKENQDDVAGTSSPCKGSGSIQPVTTDIGVEAIAKEWLYMKNRIDEIDKKAAFAADLTKMIEEIKCSVTENFSTIEKRLEMIAKSPETVTIMIEEMSSSIKSYLSRIEQRLETIEFSTKSTEPQFNSPIDDSSVSLVEDSPPLNSTSLASTDSSNQFQLSTIDFDTLRRLVENPCPDNIHQTTEGESGKTSSTLPVLANSEASTSQSVLSDDIIRKFVTPNKDVKKISSILGSAIEPRKCALKLLLFFFSEEDLRQCNTDGTHGKPALDPVKLNSLKVLLFMRFVLKCKEDEEEVWKGVKSAINSKCRANKFYKKRLNLADIAQE